MIDVAILQMWKEKSRMIVELVQGHEANLIVKVS